MNTFCKVVVGHRGAREFWSIILRCRLAHTGGMIP